MLVSKYWLKLPICPIYVDMLLCLIGATTLCKGHGYHHNHCHRHHHRGNQIASIVVNASEGRPIPDKLFGLFFEEINHAGLVACG